MKAWVTYKGGKTVSKEVPLPKMLPDDVLIEPLWISICASDVNKFVDLVGDLIKNGVRYSQEPYGPRPAKFAVISEKMMRNW